MFRGLVVFVSVIALPAFAGKLQLLSSLPNAAISQAAQLDGADIVFVAGSLKPQNPQSSQDTSDAFVAKVSADGSAPISTSTIEDMHMRKAGGRKRGPKTRV